jgi:HK97 family phage prohead protease
MGKRFILSDGSKINSKGFRVQLAGGIFERFSQNPIMLYEHDSAKVIGRWEDVKNENGKLMGTPVFDGKDTLGAEIERKVNEGFIKGASIGMIPIKFEYEDDDYVLKQWELLEVSIVPIPADSGAIVLFDENRQRLDFQKLCLEQKTNNLFTNKITKKMDGIVLPQAAMQSLGLQSGATPREAELAVFEKDREISALKSEIDKQKKAGINLFLDNAVKVGKITEQEKTHFLKLAESDFDSVKTIIDGRAEKASASLSEIVQKSGALAAREGWTYLQWMKEDPKGLAQLKAQSPKEFERLQQTLK